MNMHRSCCCTTVDAWHFINAAVVQLSLDRSGSMINDVNTIKNWVGDFIDKMNEKFGDLPEDEKPMIGVDIWNDELMDSQLPTYDYDSVFDFVMDKYVASGWTEFTPAIRHHNDVIFDEYAVLGEELERGLCCGESPDCGGSACEYPYWDDYDGESDAEPGDPISGCCLPTCDYVDSEQDCVDNYPGRDFYADIELLEGVAVLFLSDGEAQDPTIWGPMIAMPGPGVKSAYYTIGFGDADGINTQLEFLADGTEGHYFPASDLDALNFIVDTLLQQS